MVIKTRKRSAGASFTTLLSLALSACLAAGCGRTAAPGALVEAAGRGDEAAVRRLLDRGADIGERDGEGMSPLHLAARAGHAGVTRLLLEAGAGINTPSTERFQFYYSSITPLHAAALSGQAETARILLEAGADVKARNHVGVTPLHAAAFRGCPEVTRVLIEHGAEIDARDETGWTPLYTISMESGNVDAAMLLLEAGADIDAREHIKQRSPMHAATWEGNTGIIKLLLEAGADPAPIDRHGRKPKRRPEENG